MHITKSLFLAVIGLGYVALALSTSRNLTPSSAMAIADVATENEAARPSALYDFEYHGKLAR